MKDLVVFFDVVALVCLFGFITVLAIDNHRRTR